MNSHTIQNNFVHEIVIEWPMIVIRIRIKTICHSASQHKQSSNIRWSRHYSLQHKWFDIKHPACPPVYQGKISSQMAVTEKLGKHNNLENKTNVMDVHVTDK